MKVLSLFIKYQKRALIAIYVLLIFGGRTFRWVYNREDIWVPESGGGGGGGGGIHSGRGVLSGVYGMLLTELLTSWFEIASNCLIGKVMVVLWLDSSDILCSSIGVVTDISIHLFELTLNCSIGDS